MPTYLPDFYAPESWRSELHTRRGARCAAVPVRFSVFAVGLAVKRATTEMYRARYPCARQPVST